jgi:hypothetical protein
MFKVVFDSRRPKSSDIIKKIIKNNNSEVLINEDINYYKKIEVRDDLCIKKLEKNNKI